MPDHAALSDVGRRREHNEDCYLVQPLPDGLLCVVSDGMGGHAAGEVASQMACEAVGRVVPKALAGEPLLPLLEGAARNAHDQIRAAARDGREGMGCTLTVAAVRPGHIEMLHIGDSRAYLVRNGSVEQITSDDTWVGEMVREQVITEEEARTHPQRSVLTRALGIGREVAFHTHRLETSDDQVLLLCSDGLTGHVRDDRIGEVVKGAGSLADAAQELVDAANGEGGSDNITVVLVRGVPRQGE